MGLKHKFIVVVHLE